MASLLSRFRACARSQRNSCCRALALHRWDVWGRRGQWLGGWWRCGRLKPMEWKPHAIIALFRVRFLFSKMFETRMLLLLWKLFPRAFQHTPFLLGFGIDLGQTLLLLDQAADKSKRLIEPTQLTTGETFVMCVCVFVVGFVQANPNRVLQFGASGQFLLRRLQDYRIVTRARVQCCRTCHTTTYSPMSRTAGETYPKAMTKLESQELYDKLSWNCFSMNLHYSIRFIVTYSDFIIYSYISAVVSAKS